jgi:hypothetical protein
LQDTLHFHLEPRGRFLGSCDDISAVALTDEGLQRFLFDADASQAYLQYSQINLREDMYLACPSGVVEGDGYFGMYQPWVEWLELCHCGNRAEARTGRCLTCQPADEVMPSCEVCHVALMAQLTIETYAYLHPQTPRSK